MVSHDQDANAIAGYSVEKMIGETLKVCAPQSVLEEMVPFWAASRIGKETSQFDKTPEPILDAEPPRSSP